MLWWGKLETGVPECLFASVWKGTETAHCAGVWDARGEGGFVELVWVEKGSDWDWAETREEWGATAWGRGEGKIVISWD